MKGRRTSLGTVGNVVLLAALYVLTGKLGALLAVPPGYATIIWPPSGIALGMLILHGRRLWPGVLLGSFFLNAWNSGAYTLEHGFVVAKMVTALLIAVGSTTQGLVGYELIRRLVGFPLQLDRLKVILRLLCLAVPISCLVAASIGVAALYLTGVLAAHSLSGNWVTWWAGDVFGVLVFLPVVLMTRRDTRHVVWRNAAVGGLPAAAVLVLTIPLGLTFYAWKMAAEGAYRESNTAFETLATESEKALLHRLDSYRNAMLGAAGFFEGSEFVSREEWRRYVHAIQVKQTFPGINGIGWIDPVAEKDLADYVSRVQRDGAPGFQIHPTDGEPYYVIKYIEPERDNHKALGLNIAFESHRRQAAASSRDSGQTTITKRVVLVQDEQRTSGFLLLHPAYRQGMPTGTVAQRRAAFLGWIYAPFIAKNLLADLTASQGYRLNLRIYDGQDESAGSLIFSSGGSGEKHAFTVRKELLVMQQQWLIVWESTAAFEQAEGTNEPLFVLVGGLLFSGLFGLFLIIVIPHRTETMEWLAGERKFALPIAILLALGVGSYALYQSLDRKEQSYVRKRVEYEADKIHSLVRSQTDDKLLALKRMAQRWDIAGGTPYHLWQSDAFNHIHQLSGLRSLEWIDSAYRVRWAAPQRGDESAGALDETLGKAYEQALRNAKDRDAPALTPPLDMAQGYTAFVVYLPLKAHGKFDGFLSAVYAVDDFFGGAVGKDLADHFSVAISYNGRDYFTNHIATTLQDVSWASERDLRVYGKAWKLRIVPTRQFVASQQTSLPSAVFVAGLLIAALSALAARYMLVSRLKSAYLVKSNQLNSAILESTAYLVIATDENGTIVTFNKAAEEALGYKAEELVGKATPAILHDVQEVTERASTLSDELGQTVEPGFGVFVRKAEKEGIESREWTYIRKNGSRFPVNLTVTTLRGKNGEFTGYLGVVEDITVRKEMDRMKNEFISVVSHELRTPLTSIRGSLGLIQGAFSHGLPQKIKGLIDIAHSNCERLILLINDILDIDKLASGHMRFDMKEESLAELTRQAVQANEPYAGKFNTRIELAAMDESIRIKVDATRYIQVLSNLLSNAAKFSPPGGKIEVTSRLEAGRVRLDVKDRGPGIPEEFRARIFGKFTQADSSETRRAGGSGLGLHIAKQIVDHMRGRIGFETATGLGTTFWVEFPIVAEPPVTERAPKATQSAPQLSPSPALQARYPSILHVEDDVDLSKMLAVALQGKAEITLATSLQQAEELLQRQRFAMIILDIRMPDGSGLDLLKRLNARNDVSVPIVVLCADSPPAYVHTQVAAVMVKTRMSEAKIVETILSVLDQGTALQMLEGESRYCSGS